MSRAALRIIFAAILFIALFSSSASALDIYLRCQDTGGSDVRGANYGWDAGNLVCTGTWEQCRAQILQQKYTQCTCEGTYQTRNYTPSTRAWGKWEGIYSINYDQDQQACTCLGGTWVNGRCHGDDSNDESDISPSLCAYEGNSWSAAAASGQRCCGDDTADCAAISQGQLCSASASSNMWLPQASQGNCFVNDIGCAGFSVMRTGTQFKGCSPSGASITNLTAGGELCNNHYYLCSLEGTSRKIAECTVTGAANNDRDDSVIRGIGGSVIGIDNSQYYCTERYKWTKNLDIIDTPQWDPNGNSCEAALAPDSASELLKWTGNYCCGEADDRQGASGDTYNDVGGTGLCFMNRYIQNNRFLTLTTANPPLELKEARVFDGVMQGCAINHTAAGGNGYDPYKTAIKSYKDNLPGISNNWLLGYNDNPDKGGENISNGLFVKDNDYCSVRGSGNSRYFCSYEEEWQPNPGTEPESARDHLSYIKWQPVDDPNDDTDNAQYAECCQQDECWDWNDASHTGQCVSEQSGNPNQGVRHGSYLCIAGEWTNLSQKYSWDRTKSGFCMNSTQCLIDPNPSRSSDPHASNPQCIDDKMSWADHYCNAGEWTTRTSLVAQQLVSMSADHDYTLFCDTYQNAVNYCNYNVDPSIPLSQANVCSIFLQGAATSPSHACHDASGAVIPCVNNVCVMLFDKDDLSSTPDAVAVGMSLNQPVDDDDTSILKLFMASPNACNSVTGSSFGECASMPPGSAGKLLYNPSINSIIYIREPTERASWLEEAYGFLASNMRRLIRWVSSIGAPEDLSFVNFTSDFNQLYSSRQGSHSVFGVKERKAVIAGTSTAANYLTIDFRGFGADICSSINILHAGDPEVSCTVDGSSYRVFTYSYSDNSLLRNWINITSKLRVSDVGGIAVADPKIRCRVSGSSCDRNGEISLLKLSARSNAHAALAGSASAYSYNVCCRPTSSSIGTLGTSCPADTNANRRIAYLSADDNAHAAWPQAPDYSTQACLSASSGTATCTAFTGDCGDGYECLASVSATTNAHVGDCNVYNQKLCCKIQ